MSKADVARFVADVKTTTRLQNDLINKLAIADIVAVANEHGYNLTEVDVREYSEQQKAGLRSAPAPVITDLDLTEKQLEGVAGGGGYVIGAVANTSISQIKLAPAPPPPPLIQNLVGIVLF
jgi:predicted ribosomally synthesized peptide with nif11-like leader